jgi:hypothetical protein
MEPVTEIFPAAVKGRESEFRSVKRSLGPMAKVPDYFSAKETKKPNKKRIYHDDDQCRAGRDILQSERRNGTGGYRQCEECIEAYLASAA